ncbi:(S)-benzoin forming benzil reductase [Peribacillus glennii]|nr:(S)-benzoin forming benzil reductase [Peribacillus glennii]
MKTYIITGASKGLGKAIAELCLQEGNHCIFVARSANEQLIDKARSQGLKVSSILADLGDSGQLPEIVDSIFSKIGDTDELLLINNAGVVEPIKPVGQLEQNKLEDSIKVNFLAPIMLSNAFIDRTRGFPGKKTIVNVSSGAALRPYQGWAAYCSTKAGLEMFTRVTAAEQDQEQYPVTIISFSPGIMDTNMQADIRQADEKDFAHAEIFHAYKEQGRLRSPELVAEKLMALLQDGPLENGRFYDIKNLL